MRRCVSRTRWAACAAAAGLLMALSGCVLSSAPAAPEEDSGAAGVLRRAVVELDRLGTATFSERAMTTRRNGGEGAAREDSYVGEGAYDLAADTWSVERTHRPAARDGSEYKVSIAVAEDHARMRTSIAAPSGRGTEPYREYTETYTHPHTRIAGVDLGISPPRVLRLLAATTATGTRLSARGTQIIGVVPAWWAFESFGAGHLFDDLGLDERSLRGWAPVRIDLDSAGWLRSVDLQLWGSAVKPNSAQGRVLAQEFVVGTYHVELGNWGREVSITDPDEAAGPSISV